MAVTSDFGSSPGIIDTCVTGLKTLFRKIMTQLQLHCQPVVPELCRWITHIMPGRQAKLDQALKDSLESVKIIFLLLVPVAKEETVGEVVPPMDVCLGNYAVNGILASPAKPKPPAKVFRVDASRPAQAAKTAYVSTIEHNLAVSGTETDSVNEYGVSENQAEKDVATQDTADCLGHIQYYTDSIDYSGHFCNIVRQPLLLSEGPRPRQELLEEICNKKGLSNEASTAGLVRKVKNFFIPATVDRPTDHVPTNSNPMDVTLIATKTAFQSNVDTETVESRAATRTEWEYKLYGQCREMHGALVSVCETQSVPLRSCHGDGSDSNSTRGPGAGQEGSRSGGGNQGGSDGDYNYTDGGAAGGNGGGSGGGNGGSGGSNGGNGGGRDREKKNSNADNEATSDEEDEKNEEEENKTEENVSVLESQKLPPSPDSSHSGVKPIIKPQGITKFTQTKRIAQPQGIAKSQGTQTVSMVFSEATEERAELRQKGIVLHSSRSPSEMGQLIRALMTSACSRQLQRLQARRTEDFTIEFSHFLSQLLADESILEFFGLFRALQRFSSQSRETLSRYFVFVYMQGNAFGVGTLVVQLHCFSVLHQHTLTILRLVFGSRQDRHCLLHQDEDESAIPRRGVEMQELTTETSLHSFVPTADNVLHNASGRAVASLGTELLGHTVTVLVGYDGILVPIREISFVPLSTAFRDPLRNQAHVLRLQTISLISGISNYQLHQEIYDPLVERSAFFRHERCYASCSSVTQQHVAPNQLPVVRSQPRNIESRLNLLFSLILGGEGGGINTIPFTAWQGLLQCLQVICSTALFQPTASAFTLGLTSRAMGELSMDTTATEQSLPGKLHRNSVGSLMYSELDHTRVNAIISQTLTTQRGVLQVLDILSVQIARSGVGTFFMPCASPLRNTHGQGTQIVPMIFSEATEERAELRQKGIVLHSSRSPSVEMGQLIRALMTSACSRQLQRLQARRTEDFTIEFSHFLSQLLADESILEFFGLFRALQRFGSQSRETLSRYFVFVGMQGNAFGVGTLVVQLRRFFVLHQHTLTILRLVFGSRQGRHCLLHQDENESAIPRRGVETQDVTTETSLHSFVPTADNVLHNAPGRAVASLGTELLGHTVTVLVGYDGILVPIREISFVPLSTVFRDPLRNEAHVLQLQTILLILGISNYQLHQDIFDLLVQRSAFFRHERCYASCSSVTQQHVAPNQLPVVRSQPRNIESRLNLLFSLILGGEGGGINTIPFTAWQGLMQCLQVIRALIIFACSRQLQRLQARRTEDFTIEFSHFLSHLLADESILEFFGLFRALQRFSSQSRETLSPKEPTIRGYLATGTPMPPPPAREPDRLLPPLWPLAAARDTPRLPAPVLCSQDSQRK